MISTHLNNNQDDQQRHQTSRPWPKMLARIRACEESGQALVELAIVLPVLLLLLFGIAEFGLAFNTTNDETHLANEVARYLSVNNNPTEESGKPEPLLAWAKSQADNKFLQSKGKICVKFPTGSQAVGKPVEVTVHTTMEWPPILNLKTSELAGKAVMRLEATPSPALLTGSEC
jgi:TadE-like protein